MRRGGSDRGASMSSRTALSAKCNPVSLSHTHPPGSTHDSFQTRFSRKAKALRCRKNSSADRPQVDISDDPTIGIASTAVFEKNELG